MADSFQTSKEQNLAFTEKLQDERVPLGALCEVPRTVDIANPEAASFSCSSGGSVATTINELTGFPREITVTAKNVIFGSGNTLVEASRSCRFNFITPVVRKLHGRDKEVQEALDLLKTTDACPIVLLQGIVGIGKSSLAKKICSTYIAEQQSSDPPLCFMVQFTTECSSPEIIYREILIQMFGSEVLGYQDLDERGYLNLLASLCRQLPANSVVLMDDCENIPNPKMLPFLGIALDKLMTCSDHLKVVLVSTIDLSLQDLNPQKLSVLALSQEAAVKMLEDSSIPELPGPDKLEKIAQHCYGHPLLLGMALQLLPDLGAYKFLDWISHMASTHESELEESEAICRLKQFFLHLQLANSSEFIAFLELAILPGKFSLDDWELERATRSGLQRRLLIEESRRKVGTNHWSVPPVLRQFAREEREKRPDIDRKAKERFAQYFAKLMTRLSSTVYADTRFVLRELDVQRSNVQLLLNCASDWKEDLKLSVNLLSNILQGLTSPGIGYILSLRFSLKDRCKTFTSLSEVAKEVSVSKETLAKVYLELCYIKRMMWDENCQNLKDADEYAEKALQLSRSDETFYAQYLSLKGSILVHMNSWDDNAEKTLRTAVKMLQALQEMSRDQNSEKYLACTELLSSVWKDLSKVYEKRKEYNNALECLKKEAIQLRSVVFGPDHVTQVVLLMAAGRIQSKLACQVRHDQHSEMVVDELFHLATDDLKKAITICKDYGIEEHDLCGITSSVLGYTFTHRKMFGEALDAFDRAESVFKNLGKECSFRLAKVHSSRGYCYRCMEDPENEIACHKRCLALLSEDRRSDQKLMQSTYRNLVHVYKSLGNEQCCRYYSTQLKYIIKLHGQPEQ
jgi:tetratricopeptide (TPR) repeat protein